MNQQRRQSEHPKAKLAEFARAYIDKMPCVGYARRSSTCLVTNLNIATDGLSVRDYGIWGRAARGPFWIEPFFGVVQLTEAGDAIVGYDLHFGDAARGLGAVPYGKHLRYPHWFFPTEWLFRFSKGSIDGSRLQ